MGIQKVVQKFKRAIKKAVLQTQIQKALCQILQRLCSSTTKYEPQKQDNSVDKELFQCD